MAQDTLQQLLNQAIQQARSGDKAAARTTFVQALRLDATNETALIGLVTVVTDPRERLGALRKAYQLYPDSAKVNEAMRRLGISADQLTAGSAPAAPPPTVAPFSVPATEPAPADPPARPTLKRLTSTSEMPAVPQFDLSPESDPDPEAASPTLRPLSGLRKLAASSPVEDPLATPDRPATVTLDEVIARLNKAPAGDSGVPLPNINRLQLAAQEADALVSQFNSNRPQSAIAWGEKKVNRAGERDRRVFRTRVAGASTVAVVVLAVFSLALALGNPDFQRLVFAPTWTVSPTATASATPTPGLTPTPSPTSRVTLTPSPTFPSQFATRDPLVQPRPTDVNAPNGVLIEPLIQQAVMLLNQGDYDAARAILTREEAGVEQTGNFVPFYYAVKLDVAEGNLRAAREAVTRGEELWVERSNNELLAPMINVSYARVGLAEQARGSSPESLSKITDRLEASIAFDTEFVDAYLLLADRWLLDNDTSQALKSLERGLDANPTNVELRTKRAEILIRQRNYGAASQELHDALLLDPYSEKALQLQIEVAFAQDNPGLAVIYAEQYMARYPGRVLAVKLRGDARLAEGKPDLALIDYTRALNGNPKEPAYLDVLLARATLYRQLDRIDLAQQDLGRALEIREDERLRLSRMQFAFESGDDELALADAQRLTAGNNPPAAAVMIENAILLRRGGTSDTAIQAIRNVLGNLNGTLLGSAYETLADAYFAQDDYPAALDMLNTAIRTEPTLARRLLRARIAETQATSTSTSASERTRLLQQALDDYRWVQTFSAYYSDVDITTLNEAITRVATALG